MRCTPPHPSSGHPAALTGRRQRSSCDDHSGSGQPAHRVNRAATGGDGLRSCSSGTRVNSRPRTSRRMITHGRCPSVRRIRPSQRWPAGRYHARLRRCTTGRRPGRRGPTVPRSLSCRRSPMISTVRGPTCSGKAPMSNSSSRPPADLRRSAFDYSTVEYEVLRSVADRPSTSAAHSARSARYWPMTPVFELLTVECRESGGP